MDSSYYLCVKNLRTVFMFCASNYPNFWCEKSRVVDLCNKNPNSCWHVRLSFFYVMQYSATQVCFQWYCSSHRCSSWSTCYLSNRIAWGMCLKSAGDTTPLLQQAPMRQLRHSLHISGKQDSYSVNHKDDDCIRNAASLQIEAASHWRIVPSNSKHMPEGARTISISGLLTNGDERGTRRPHHHQRFMLIIFHPRRKSLTKNEI